MDSEGIPPVVARMWGRETTSRRGPRPGLDLATVTAAAITIADEHGLGGVSMSAVAARLGVAPMSLYRYVGSKDELLAVMVDTAVAPPPEIGSLPWREYLVVWTRANRDTLLERSWLLAIPRGGPPLGPRHLHWLDRALASLADTGLDEGEKVNAAATLTGYAYSNALLAHGFSVGSAAPDGDFGLKGAGAYAAVLHRLIDPVAYPALSRAVRAGGFGESEEWLEDEDFRFGLDLLLDGIEARIARRT